MGSVPRSGRSPGRGNGNPLQYSCLENPHGWRSLAGYSPRGCKESDTTEVTKHICTPKSTKWQERYSGASGHSRWAGCVHAHFMGEETGGLSSTAAPRGSAVCLVAGPLSCPSQCLACVEETARILGLGSWHWRLSCWVTLSKSSTLAFSVCPKAMTATLSSLGRHEG